MLILLRSRRRREDLDEAEIAHEEEFAAERRRRRRRELEALCVCVVALLAGEKLAPKRRIIRRGHAGWEGSAINEYVVHGDEQTYKDKFRVSRKSFKILSNHLTDAGYLMMNNSRNPERRQSAEFKLGVCLYFMAGKGKGDLEAVGDAGHIARSTVLQYLDDFCNAVCIALKEIYMPSEAPSPANVVAIRKQFASRRGIANVGMATDGCHIPYVPQHERTKNDYKNYKGWTSILVVAFVNSFHLFVEAQAGHPGRWGDNTVLKDCWFLAQVRRDPKAWLGEDGLIAADGGASDGGNLLLNPIPNAKEIEDKWYNFCHSSTRFFVEETFGRWKNRFRFLLFANDLEHARMTQLIYTSCILHNACTILADDAVDFSAGADEEWEEFFKNYEGHACPSCIRRNSFHCVHVEKNKSVKPIKLDSKGAKDVRIKIRAQLWNDLHNSGMGENEALAEIEAREDRMDFFR